MFVVVVVVVSSSHGCYNALAVVPQEDGGIIQTNMAVATARGLLGGSNQTNGIVNIACAAVRCCSGPCRHGRLEGRGVPSMM